MRTFAYEGHKADGLPLKGSITACDEASAAENLRAAGIFVLDIKEGELNKTVLNHKPPPPAAAEGIPLGHQEEGVPVAPIPAVEHEPSSRSLPVSEASAEVVGILNVWADVVREVRSLGISEDDLRTAARLMLGDLMAEEAKRRLDKDKRVVFARVQPLP